MNNEYFTQIVSDQLHEYNQINNNMKKILSITLTLCFSIINIQSATKSSRVCPTISYCSNCTYSNTQCTSCFLNYGWSASSGLCQPCSKFIPRCRYCSTINTCSQCIQGYQFSNSISCEPCLTNCAKCISAFTCDECIGGYQKVVNRGTGVDQCLKICPNNCIDCSSSISCNKCQNSYYLNQKYICSPCYQIILYCDVCNSVGQLCSVCSKGYVLQDVKTINGTLYGQACIAQGFQISSTSLDVTLNSISSTSGSFRGTDITFFIIFYILFGLILLILVIILIRLICIDYIRWRRQRALQGQNKQS